MTKKVKQIINNPLIKKLLLAFLAILSVISVVQGIKNAYIFSQDFQWDAARALMEGINPYDESVSPTGALKSGALGDFYAYFERIGAPQRMEANQFPSLLMILYPYALMLPGYARIAWIISNLVFTAMICILLRKTFLKDISGYTYALLMLLMLSGTPYRNQLGVGQHTLMAFAFFLLAVYLSKRSLKSIPAQAGTIISLFICYFKYTLTAPLMLWFVYKKKYKEIIISVFLHGLLTAAAAASLGDSVINMIIKPLRVASVLTSEGGIDLGAVFNGSPVSFILAGIAALFLFVLTLSAMKSEKSEALKDCAEGVNDRPYTDCGNMIFAVALLWSLILTYHRTYDFFVLSAAGCLLASLKADAGSNFSAGRIKFWVTTGYWVMLISVFFILRIFSESTASKLVAGAIYYAYTIFITVLLAVKIFKIYRY